MARKSEPTRFEWSGEARRVQPLRNGVRVFDHAGRAHVFADRPESIVDAEALLASIAEVDVACHDRIVAELAVWAAS